jgi:Raf kinase inhibitor-like YbhB/YbcL family protein
MNHYMAVAVLLGAVVFANPPATGGFKLESPDLKPGKRMSDDQVFSGFGCSGKNISPALQWQNAPKTTKSFAVTMYDPDAPTGSGWWHWIIFNIPANVTSLSRNAGDPASLLAPEESVQSKTDFGTRGYGGACPPPGSKPHHYQVTVYALDIDKLPLDASASGAMVGFSLRQHTIDRATITVLYSR